MARVPASRGGKSAKKRPLKNDERNLKRKREDEAASLEARFRDFDFSSTVAVFTGLPISKATADGLSDSNFRTMTTIQRTSIPLALRGKDILGAAKTGSGKTLAFLVPLLERLVRKRWTEYDGLGALVISPTRELAMQIWEVLTKIGRKHMFSAGLLIGGKSLQEEQDRLGRMQILISTPGRLLQHLDQTHTFEVSSLQLLVLDEADRILDMGFSAAVDAIIDHLPKERQTLLFSATQTKRISDLARLSLKDPEYVAVHETAESATPEKLKQSYVVTPLMEKLNTLWGFIRANVKAKILVFFSSGKQVRFVYEAFRHLRPGIPLLHLHGRQRQSARLDVTSRFAASKNACLFSTDLTARGLDFPSVDWICQVDCAEDAETYIHRVGRTARFEREGRAVLFLDPSEKEGMLKRLGHKRVPIEEIKVKQNKQKSIQNELQNLCFQRSDLKYLGQKAVISYIKSIHLQKDKEIFKTDQLPLEDFARSLGLPGAPRINFRHGQDAKKLKNAPRQQLQSFSDAEEELDPQQESKTTRTKYDRMFERQNQDILSSHYANLIEYREHGDEDLKDGAEKDEGFFSAKRRLPSDSMSSSPEPSENLAHNGQAKKIVSLGGQKALVIDSKRREKLLKSKKQLLKYKGLPNRLVFDDEGKPHEVYEMKDEEDFKKAGPVAEQRQQFVDEERGRVRAADVKDKALAKEKRKAKKEKRKEREREALAEAESGVSLAPFEDEDGGESPRSNQSNDEMDRELSSPEPLTRSPKRRKLEADLGHRRKGREQPSPSGKDTLEDLEALASSYL